ncbi:MAG: glycosyltransferase [Armatimonadetes bacterium]|nr:glycosyltransferase [Armatimonadota bacterium]
MPGKLRIGIFTNAYRPFISGVVNSVDLIRKGLLRLGHVPFVFAPDFPGYVDEHSGVFRFRSLQLSSKVKFPLPIPFSTRIFPKIPRMRLDVIHTHHPFLLGEVGAHFAQKLKVPLVYTFHTQYEQYSHYVPFNQHLVRTLARNSVVTYSRKCDLIVAPSPTIRSLLDEYGISNRTVTLQNAVDTGRFRGVDGAPTRDRHGIPRGAVVMMYAGRIGLEKNLEFLLRAWWAVCSSRREAWLMVVGDGPELGNLRGLARELGAADRMVFPGPVDYKRMPEYFASADAFIMTSTTEVKPLVVLEAMASGLPVIAVAACGTEDTIRHGHDGLLSACEPEAFQAIVRKALEDRDLRIGMGRAAIQTAAAYSIGAYTDRLVELYTELRSIPV